MNTPAAVVLATVSVQVDGRPYLFASLAELGREVAERQARVQASARATLAARIELGHWLLGAREVVPHGGWYTFLSTHGVHEKTAENAMKLARAQRGGAPVASASTLRQAEIRAGVRSGSNPNRGSDLPEPGPTWPGDDAPADVRQRVAAVGVPDVTIDGEAHPSEPGWSWNEDAYRWVMVPGTRPWRGEAAAQGGESDADADEDQGAGDLGGDRARDEAGGEQVAADQAGATQASQGERPTMREQLIAGMPIVVNLPGKFSHAVNVTGAVKPVQLTMDQLYIDVEARLGQLIARVKGRALTVEQARRVIDFAEGVLEESRAEA